MYKSGFLRKQEMAAVAIDPEDADKYVDITHLKQCLTDYGINPWLESQLRW